jgi:hypothetical protein
LTTRLHLTRPVRLIRKRRILRSFSPIGKSFQKIAPLTPAFATLTKTTGAELIFLIQNLFLAAAFTHFVNVLFSRSCKTLNPQLLSFDTHTKPRAVGGIVVFSLLHYFITSLLLFLS